MKTKRILICILVLCLMVSVLAACGHKHEYGTLVGEVAPTCEETGTKAYYHCAECGLYFDQDKNEITDLRIPAAGHNYGTLIEEQSATHTENGVKAHYTCSVCQKNFDTNKNFLADLVIPATGHSYQYQAKVEPSIGQTGTKEHYTCTEGETTLYFVTAGTDYVEVTYDSLVIPALQATRVEATEATFEATGVKEHYVTDGEEGYYIFENDQYTKVDYSTLIIPVKEYDGGAIVLNEKAVVSYDANGLTSERVLESVWFDVTAKDGTVLTVKATSVKNFAATVGKYRTFTFAYEVAGNTIFEKDVTLDIYNANYVIMNKNDTLADGDQFVIINGNSWAFSSNKNGNYYEGVQVPRQNVDGVFLYATIDPNSPVLVFTAKASSIVDGTFHIVHPDGTYLCGGMGYPQFIPSTSNDADLMAASFEVTIADNYRATMHGQRFNWSYLSAWNEVTPNYFFVTTTATYGYAYFIYRLEKDYTNHTHEVGEFAQATPATCTAAGTLGHYTCTQCDSYLNADMQIMATIVDPIKSHDYKLNEMVAPTVSNTGMAEHYTCNADGCNLYFTKVDETYQEVAYETLVIAKIPTQLVEAKPATLLATGNEEYYTAVVDGQTSYYVMQEGTLVATTLEAVTLAQKVYSGDAITINAKSPVEFEIKNLTEQSLLAGMFFDVPCTDGTVLTVNANAVVGFDGACGKDKTLTFKFMNGEAEVFAKEATLSFYEAFWKIMSQGDQLVDGDKFVIVNGYSWAFSSNKNGLYYEGVQITREYIDGVYLYAHFDPNSPVLVFTAINSSVVEGAFHIVHPDGTYLCGGMGYPQFIPSENTDTNLMAASFVVTVNAGYNVTMKGQYFNWCYLSAWNEVTPHYFFVTNSANYGYWFFIYRLEKSYDAHQHVYGKLIAEQPATCESEGVKAHYNCIRCGKNFDENKNELASLVIPMVPHDYGTLVAATPAGCDTDGNYAHYKCSICEGYFDESFNPLETATIAARGHQYGEFVEAVEATCEEAGTVKHCYCPVCEGYFDTEYNKLETINVEKLGHNFGALQTQKDATCTTFGTKEHYNCQQCGFNYDAAGQRLTSIYIDMHNYENGKCKDCQHVKPLSVSEAKQVTDPSALVIVRGIVIGCTGNYDGGYSWLIIKDLDNNETCAIRKSRPEEYDGERKLGGGYSYAPTIPFELGDVVELPVSVTRNTATRGGETNKLMFIYRGDSFDGTIPTEQLVAKYKVGQVDSYRLNLEETLLVIDDQGDLENFVLQNDNQWKLVCIKGTADKPLKMTTRSATEAGKGDISREYIYLFYDNPTSLDGQKVNGASPVFSNFGNQFNLTSYLSSILFGQEIYEDLNWSQPYEFVGEIYCMIIGGSTSYYHFVVMDPGDIVNESFEGIVPIAGKVSKNTFFKFQEENASKLGITVGKNINSAVGVTGVVNCEDMCKIGIAAVQNPVMNSIWGKSSYTSHYTNAEGKNINLTVNHAVLELEQCKKWILPNYTVVGSKSGWLNYTSETRPYYVCNCLVAVEGPDDTYMVGYVYNKRGDNGDDSVYYYLNILYQILEAKYYGQDTADLEARLACDSCVGAIIPKDGSAVDGYDYFGADSKFINYSKNGKELITTASTWKTFTGLTCVRYFTEEQLDMKITVTAEDLNSIDSMPPLKEGDVITLRDALHFMMLPSSNVAPTIIARAVGEDILRNAQI